MHYVSRIDEASASTPPLYAKWSSGFRRATYVDQAVGSVHMGVGICYLEPDGFVSPHVHSFEESFYILEGSIGADIAGKTETLGAGHFGLIKTGVPHAFRNTGAKVVRWLEMQAPQPRTAEYGRDTFFIDGSASFPGVTGQA